MTDLWLAFGYALFLWWFGTGAVLLMGRASRMTSTILASAMGLAAIWGVWATMQAETLWSALFAFTAGVGLWGFHEATFLSGAVTGPRRTPCPPGAHGLRRFALAASTLIHHELALALTLAALAIWLQDAANPVALWTFGALWAMRLSVKFNLFLGAPNVADEFLPDDLRYLATYFSSRPMSMLFPFSVTVGTVAAGGLLLHAATVAQTPFAVAGLTLVGGLTALGTLEHWFLVLPVREAALWRWWTEKRAEKRANRAEGALKLMASTAPTPGR